MSRMLRRLALLWLLVAVKVVVIDRILAAWRAGAGPAPLRMLEVVDAPPDQVWSIITDIPLQTEWMREMQRVEVETPGPVRVGTRGTATLRIMGVTVSDPVEVTVVEAPRIYAIRHEGLFSGGGVITLEPGADGTTTVVRWVETLVPPVLPHLVSLVQAPILRRIFQDDLHRLKALVETGAVD